jgi:vitamin B12 transporter
MKSGLISIAILLSCIAKAQVKITGKVTDTKNKPLQGASITIKNTYDGATTDSLGNFSIVTDEKGEQLIEVTISGYRSAEQKVLLATEPASACHFH